MRAGNLILANAPDCTAGEPFCDLATVKPRNREEGSRG